jgi:hypothetical protein
MPNHGLESFGMGRDSCWVNGGHDNASVANFTCVATIPANYPDHFCPYGFGKFEGLNDIRGDILLDIAPAYREYHDSVIGT